MIAVARVENVEPLNSKIIFTINDNTDSVNVVNASGENPDDVQIGDYYEMVLGVREEKDEVIVLCERLRRVASFEQVNWHILKVISASLERQNLKNRG